MAPMTTSTKPAPVAPTESESGRLSTITSRFDLTDKRNLIGLGVMAFCLGVMVGARLMRGAMPAPESGGVAPTVNPTAPITTVFRDVPGPVQYVKGDDCPECAEKKLQEQRERERVANAQSAPPAETPPQSFTVPRGTEPTAD